MSYLSIRRMLVVVAGLRLLFAGALERPLFAQRSAEATAPQQDELQARIKAAAVARDGDPQSVAKANSLVLALAYRRLC